MGHTAMSVVGPGNRPGRDLVVAFTTGESPPPTLASFVGFSIRALTGIELTPSIVTLADIVEIYSLEENRDITRIPLQMTPENKKQMVTNLNKVLSYNSTTPIKEKMTAYTFLFDNCAGLLVKLLKDSGMPSEFFGIAIPTNVPAHLFRTYNALYPGISISKGSSLARNFDALPAEMYQFCQDAVCAAVVRSTFLATWPQQEIEYPRFEKVDPAFEPETLRSRSEPSDWASTKPFVLRHFELLRQL